MGILLLDGVNVGALLIFSPPSLEYELASDHVLYPRCSSPVSGVQNSLLAVQAALVVWTARLAPRIMMLTWPCLCVMKSMQILSLLSCA